MSDAAPTNRELKKRVGQWLDAGNGEVMPEDLVRQPARRLINPLLSFLCSRRARIKWRAVTAIGRLTAELADRDMESARVIMRRLMWSLNDESGGIGWGAPEAMGEIMARHPRLADEFHAMLISYLSPEKNYLEHEPLQPGVLWGLGRLARTRKELAGKADKYLPPYLASPRADIRGHAAWAAIALDSESLSPILDGLIGDDQEFELYRNQHLEKISISQIVNR